MHCPLWWSLCCPLWCSVLPPVAASVSLLWWQLGLGETLLGAWWVLIMVIVMVIVIVIVRVIVRVIVLVRVRVMHYVIPNYTLYTLKCRSY